MKKKILLCLLIAWLATPCMAQTVTDYDGNVYDTVMIGSQAWLKQNLKVTHYRNGVPVPGVAGGTVWAGLTTGTRCYYDNDSAAYASVYGTLYNWYVINNPNGICPYGWHVPGDAEWTETENFLGGSIIAGGKMKEAGTQHWLSPNTGATNSSGFTGLPGGMLGTSFTFSAMFENGLWWTSTPQGPGAAWSRYLWYLFAGVDRNPTPKTIALSIRCVRDPGVGFEENEDRKIRLYPNPSQHWITVEWDAGRDAGLEIIDAFGRSVMQTRMTGKVIRLDIGVLSPGVYILRLQSGDRTFQEKLLKR